MAAAVLFFQLGTLYSLLAILAEDASATEPTGDPWLCHVIDDTSRGADGAKLADLNGDGLSDIATGWEEGGVTRVYLNPGQANVRSRWPSVTVGETPSVEDAVFADLDGDGRLDVVSCCEGTERRVFVHWAPDETGDLLSASRWKQEVLPASETHAQKWMFAWPLQVNGRGGVDLVAGSRGGAAQVGWFEAPADARDVSAYRWRPISDAGWIMSIWKRDMDADGDLDLVVSDRRGPLRGCRWLENPGAGPAQRSPWASHPMGGGDRVVLSMVLGDFDGDQLEDALVATSGAQLLFLKRLDEAGRQWEALPIPADYDSGNPRAVVMADIDRDGRLDLAITTSEADGKHGVFWMKRLGADWRWEAHSISGKSRGIKYDRIEMLDLDGDGDLDLLTTEEREAENGLGVVWYENPYNKATTNTR